MTLVRLSVTSSNYRKCSRETKVFYLFRLALTRVPTRAVTFKIKLETERPASRLKCK